MNLRRIILQASCSGYGSGYGDEFDDKFNYNTWFVSNFLSRQIRKMKIPTDGPYNTLFCYITKNINSCKLIEHLNNLEIGIHFSETAYNRYMGMKAEHERFRFYLSLLEKGYQIASAYHYIPFNEIRKLHQALEDSGYKNEWLFKKKRIKEYGITITLEHVLTTYDYRLMLKVSDLKNNLLGEGPIYVTYPDDIFFNKNVRHLVVEQGRLIVTDFLDIPQFVCDLRELQKGIVKSKCVYEHTRKYIPNDDNRWEFERLKW